MIPPDGLHKPEHYPPEQPVLSPPVRKVTDYPAVDYDRVFWVTVLRPQLIAAGNLVETDEMRAEFKKLSKVSAKLPPPVVPNVTPATAAVRTPSGDWVPAPAKPAPPPVRDFKAAAAGERDDEPEPGCPF